MNTRPPYMSPEKPLWRSRSNRTRDGTMDWSKLGKECVKAVYCHPAYLTYMQSTLWEMLGWMYPKLESRLPGEISTTSDMQMIPLSWKKAKSYQKASWGWKSSEKAALNIQKTEIMSSGSNTSWQLEGGKVESSDRFYFLGLQNHCRWWLQPQN